MFEENIRGISFPLCLQNSVRCELGYVSLACFFYAVADRLKGNLEVKRLHIRRKNLLHTVMGAQLEMQQTEVWHMLSLIFCSNCLLQP